MSTLLNPPPSFSPSEEASDVYVVEPPRPSRFWSQLRFLIGIVIALAIGLAGGWWWTRNQIHESEKIHLDVSSNLLPTEGTPITASSVTYRMHQRFVDATGSVGGYEELTLSAKTEGRVQAIHHDLADRVKPGDLLLQIDPTDAQLAVNQAQRSLNAELAKWGFAKIPEPTDDLSVLPTVQSARLKADLAQTKLRRLLSLQGNNVVSQDDLEQAKSDAQVLEADWKNQSLMANAAAATVKLREAELQIAEQKLRDTQVIVPHPTLVAHEADEFYSIAQRMVSEGSLVRNGDPLFKLVLGQTVKVRLILHELHSASVLPGQRVEIETAATDQFVVGKVVRVSPVVDTQTRTFQVEAEVNNADSRLKPGSFVKARILIGEQAQIVTIPVTGLDSFAGVNKVFLIKDGTAKEVRVKSGYQAQDWIEIVEPILPKDAVIATSGQRLLSDGSKVSIRQATEGQANHSEPVSASPSP